MLMNMRVPISLMEKLLKKISTLQIPNTQRSKIRKNFTCVNYEVGMLSKVPDSSQAFSNLKELSYV